jgi:hypothetical protein
MKSAKGEAIGGTGNAEIPSLSPPDLANAFPPSVVRAQLYREEPKLPRISVKGAGLIGTTSALFLKNLVERSAAIFEESSSAKKTTGNDKDDDDSSERLIKCADIYKVVEKTEIFEFLKEPLEESGIQEMIRKEQTHLTEYKTPAKRKRAPAASSRTAKKVLQSVKQQNDDFGVAPSEFPADEIIADEDDYD